MQTKYKAEVNPMSIIKNGLKYQITTPICSHFTGLDGTIAETGERNVVDRVQLLRSNHSWAFVKELEEKDNVSALEL